MDELSFETLKISFSVECYMRRNLHFAFRTCDMKNYFMHFSTKSKTNKNEEKIYNNGHIKTLT